MANILKFFSTLLLLLFVLIACAPQLLSTPLGNALIARQLSRSLHGQVQARHISLSWFHSQHLTDFRWISSCKQAPLAITCEAVNLSIPLHKLLLGSFVPLHLTIQQARMAPDLCLEALELRSADTTLTLQGHGHCGEGSFSLQGTYLTHNSHPRGELHLEVQSAPTALADRIAALCGLPQLHYQQLFGSFFHLRLHAHCLKDAGPIQCTITSPNTRLAMHGELTEGVLRLTQPLYAQIALTHRLLHSDSPITLQVSQEGFYLPLFPLDLSALEMPHARVELGKARLSRSRTLEHLLYPIPLPSSDPTLWFAPLDLRIKNGQLEIERTELLLENQYPFALWGSIDLPTQQLDLRLGVPTYVSDATLAQIPIRGTLRLPTLGTLTYGDSSIPAAKPPFPWDHLPPSSQPKKAIKKGDKLFKQLLKVLR